jgi:hypothetical protein
MNSAARGRCRCPMLISVMADIAVTALRVLEEHPPASVIAIPLLSVSIEVVFIAVLARLTLPDVRGALSPLP